MKKKGFTLIELLAVIVILAVIALIAVPIILNIIKNAKIKATEDSVYGFVEAIEFNNAVVGTSTYIRNTIHGIPNISASEITRQHASLSVNKTK